MTIVRTCPLGPPGVALGVEILDEVCVHILVEGVLGRHVERELGGELHVKGDGRLPDLGHLEVGVDACNLGGQLSLVGRNLVRVLIWKR